MNGLVVMISGKGTLLQAMLDAKLPITAVLVDRECQGLHIAEQAGIQSWTIARRDFGPSFDQEAFTQKIKNILVAKDPALVAMAGFKTILHKSLFESFAGRIINIHPSLLPSFPGSNAVREALAYGVKISGCTIHYATSEVDAGLILLQEFVPVLSSDTQESLYERIHQKELEIYPQFLKALLD